MKKTGIYIPSFSFYKKMKKGVVTEYLPWLLISLAVLAIVMVTIFFLKQEGTSLIDKIKDIFRFK